MGKITPFLWFGGQAMAAAKYYTSIFKNSRITGITRYGKGAPLPAGTVMTVAFQLNGQDFTVLNGSPSFKFNESVSFVVTCGSQKEIDYYWKKLTRGGKGVACGWLKDKYGLSWQVVPSELPKLLQDKDKKKSQRVLDALMRMVKLDIGKLKKAYNQKQGGKHA